MNTPGNSAGSYTYLCNGENSGVEESWEISHRGDELHLESVRYARPVGITLRVRSVHKDGQFQRCMLHWLRQLNEHSVEISADYCFDETGVTVFQHCGAEEVEFREAGREFVFSPLMRIYNGPIIEKLAQSTSSHQVLVPWIKEPDQVKKLLRPDYSERQAELIRDDELIVDGKTLACKEYDYSGGEYLSGTRFWIDENQVMLKYCWQQDEKNLWEVILSSYKSAA
jgi:hypothetical protein